MEDNQNFINKMTQQEKNTTAIALLILELKELQKEVEKLKQKIKAYEPKKNI